MPCEPIRSEDGQIVGFSCSRGRPGCDTCGAPSVALCDYPVASGTGGTCDARMCERHRHRVGPGVDYCPRCRRAPRRWSRHSEAL